MERLAYILDTNMAADYINGVTAVRERLHTAKRNQHNLYLTQPVHYEVLRGLLRANATRKLSVFEEAFVPLLNWLPLTDADWRRAAELWAEARKAGKQLSDVDFLIAAMTLRLNGILVSADDDFDALPIKHENWRDVNNDKA